MLNLVSIVLNKFNQYCLLKKVTCWNNYKLTKNNQISVPKLI